MTNEPSLDQVTAPVTAAAPGTTAAPADPSAPTAPAVIAYLLDGGDPAAVTAGQYEAPWDEIVAWLAEVPPADRGREFEAVAGRQGEAAASIKASVYAEARARFARAKTGALDAVKPALEDEKGPVDDVVLRDVLYKKEMGDARLFAHLYTNQVVYDHAEDAWHLWSGQQWETDRVRAIVPMLSDRLSDQYYAAIKRLRDARTDANKDKIDRDLDECLDHIKHLCGRRYLDNVLTLATAMPGLRITGDEWDNNPWILGVKNGALDLKSGNLRPGHPGDMMRAICPTEWRGIDEPAPRWEQFLQEIFVADQGLIDYVQRLLGYGITGMVTDHVFPILYGSSRNGKTKLLEAIATVLGKDLATSVPSDALMASRIGNNSPQPFIYAMRGKRIVWASETNEGRRIDASLVKLLTGGDRIKVRSVYTKPVEFAPTHLLLLLTNYKPKAPSEDLAIWDRVALIPFTLRYIINPDPTNPTERLQDPNLGIKLASEASGILSWLVRGCLAWQKYGLNPPASVMLKTQEYKNEEDTIAPFIAENLDAAPGKTMGSTELYKMYAQWCKDMRVKALSHTAFGIEIGKECDKFRDPKTGRVKYIGFKKRELELPGMFSPDYLVEQENIDSH